MSALELRDTVARAALRVTCGECGAAAGEACVRRSTTGRTRPRAPHRYRVDRAYAKRSGRPRKGEE